MKFRKYFAAASAACLMLTGTAALPALTVSAEETQAATSGTFKNITWEFDTETKTLTVSGTGSTGTYFLSGLPREGCPWYVFRDMTEKIVVSEGITQIDWGLFSEHYNLRSVQLPESLTAIGDCAFAACYSLTDINIPESVTKFGVNAFYDTGWLKSQLGILRFQTQRREVKDPLLIKNDILIDGTQIGVDQALAVSYTIPSGVKAIGGGAFREAKYIGNVYCCDDVTEIGDSAFELSDIKEITLGSQVRTIGIGACYQCPNLEKVTIGNALCQIDDSAATFSNSPSGKEMFTGTICGYEGSTAQAYAEKYGYAFESVGYALTLSAGDVNGDDAVGLDDVQTLLAYYTETVAGKKTLFAEMQKNAADVDRNEKVDVADVQYMLKYYTENEVAKKNLLWADILK